MYITRTRFESEAASKYLQQLCKHFGHKVPAEFTTEKGDVHFPFGLCELLAEEGVLHIVGQVPSLEAAETLKNVLVSHLVKFAWREEVDLQWHTKSIAEDAQA